MILMPVTGLSLFYLSGILEDVINITQVDAGIVEGARSMRESLHAATGTEIAFVLFHENSYLEQNRRYMDQIRRATLEGLPHLGESDTEFERLPELVAQYDVAMTRLADLYAAPSSSAAEPLADFERGMSRLLARLRSLRDQAEAERDPAARRGLFEEMKRVTESTPRMLLESIDPENPGRASLLEELSRLRERMDAILEGIQDRAIAHIESHRRHVVVLSSRAQRNILTTIVLTGLAGISLILFLPARVVKTLNRITHIVQQAERGDLDVADLETGSDEVGTLAVHLNRLMHQVRTFDELKTERMLRAERRLDALVDNLEEGVLLVDDEFHPVYVSQRARRLLGPAPEGADDARIAALLANGELSALVRDALSGQAEQQPRTLDLDVGGKGPRRLRAWADPVLGPEGEVKEILLLMRKVA